MLAPRPAAIAAFVIACAAASARTPAWAESSEVIDRVVAVVQIRAGAAGSTSAAREKEHSDDARPLPPEVITLSGLDFEARVALIQRGAMGAATAPLDDETLRDALENAINERLLAGEAEVLEAWRVEPAELDAAMQAFRDKFESEADLTRFLDRHEADLTALSKVLERHLRASKVLDSKVRLRAQVADSDVKRYFDEHRADLPGTWEEVRGALREKLYRERSQQLVQAELEQLRRTHDVRRIAPFARGVRGAEAEAGRDAG